MYLAIGSYQIHYSELSGRGWIRYRISCMHFHRDPFQIQQLPPTNLIYILFQVNLTWTVNSGTGTPYRCWMSFYIINCLFLCVISRCFVQSRKHNNNLQTHSHAGTNHKPWLICFVQILFIVQYQIFFLKYQGDGCGK